MKHSKYWLLLLLVLSCFINQASAQEIRCEQLTQIVKVIAEDSTFQILKGGVAREASQHEKAQYFTLVPVWYPTDDTHGEYIDYDNDRHSYVYRAYSINQRSGKEELQHCIKILDSCLSNGWITTTAVDKSGDTVTYFKNPASHVVISIEYHEVTVLVACYRD